MPSQRDLDEYAAQTRAMKVTLHLPGVDCVCLPCLSACRCGHDRCRGYAIRHCPPFARVRRSEGGHP